jgi:branched-chain amino acid transport system substrate-binding protein
MDTEAMLSYQAIYVIADALERAGSADPADVRAALATTNLADHYMAYPGPITFDETGENVNAQPVLMQVIDGLVQQVYPLDLRETDPVFPGTAWSNN